MNVDKLYPQGYCKGVFNAIKITLETRKLYPNEKIYILGLIIHNKLIKNELEKLNIISLYSKEKSRLELLDDITDGIVILTAHGTDIELINKIKNKNLKYIDTTCNYVSSTYDIIKKELNNDHEVIYIGIHNHPEATATTSICPKKIHLIQTSEEIQNLNLNDKSPLITNQTTLSINQIENIYTNIITKYPNARLSNEQCSATRLRQKAIIDISDKYDLILVVGDSLSNNSRQLYNLAKEKCEAHLIESIEDIEIDWLKNKKYIAITSGASTPSSIVNQIYIWIKNFSFENKDSQILPKTDYSNILSEFSKL